MKRGSESSCLKPIFNPSLRRHFNAVWAIVVIIIIMYKQGYKRMSARNALTWLSSKSFSCQRLALLGGNARHSLTLAADVVRRWSGTKCSHLDRGFAGRMLETLKTWWQNFCPWCRAFLCLAVFLWFSNLSLHILLLRFPLSSPCCFAT